MKSIIVGMYIAAAAFSSVGPSCISAAATEPTKETTKRKTRARRLRRKNVLTVEQNVNSINDESNNSDMMRDDNDGNRKLVKAGTISKINRKGKRNAESFASVNVSELKNEHIVEGGDLEALFAMTQTQSKPKPKNEFSEKLDDEESDMFFALGRVHLGVDAAYSMPTKQVSFRWTCAFNLTFYDIF